jgi:hypothetical protein
MSNVSAAQTAAGFIPVVGGILSNVIGVAGQLGLKTKTTHLSWQDADNLARPFANNLTASVENNFAGDDESRKLLWQAYQARMTGFISGDEEGSTWWTADTRNLYWNAFTYELPRDTQHNSLWYCFWLSAHWVFENVDGQHIETEGKDKLNYIISQVLVPAFSDSGVIISASDVAVDTTGKTTGSNPPPTAKTTVNQASLFGGIPSSYLAIGAIVLLIAAAVYHQRTGKG